MFQSVGVQWHKNCKKIRNKIYEWNHLRHETQINVKQCKCHDIMFCKTWIISYLHTAMTFHVQENTSILNIIGWLVWGKCTLLSVERQCMQTFILKRSHTATCTHSCWQTHSWQDWELMTPQQLTNFKYPPLCSHIRFISVVSNEWNVPLQSVEDRQEKNNNTTRRQRLAL